ncbi:MAG TPA: TetR family transcriptional regulator [Amycolatopsis sp.]|uniref:TetR/AcrR family transcriptional regulator n=1 Tax=Amycolatopsis sp. TaxID=37632 RepID=UPI002B470626|nr:TetR family transcriptional regulator [Amycolatopsis sp.]HKS45186.1 TetR family transcriptional regulator [Amycolatopsis sp.]
MAKITFMEQTKASLREALLDAATDLLATHGYGGLRMVDVAAAAGVSRQTVYNEFGNKTSLVQAVALRTTSEFLEGIRLRLDSAGDLLTGVHAAVVYTIEHATDNELVASALGTRAGEDLLPLLTTRGEPVLSAASGMAAVVYRELAPDLDEHSAELLAETVVRLALSHLTLRTHSATEAADMICAAVVAPFLASRRSSTME